MEKIIRLQDAKHKIHDNNSNEASIFIDQSIASELNLFNQQPFVFTLNKENILKALAFTYSFSKPIYKRKNQITLDSEWFNLQYKIINDFFDDNTDYTVNVNVASDNRTYLNKLVHSESKFNIRNLLIQNHYKIIFSDQLLSLEYSFEPYSSDNQLENDITISDIDSGHQAINKVYYGAPGTGKSHKVKELTKISEEKNRVERVTFHPEYDYYSFVGGYKPTMDGENIRYEFVPQAFTNIYVKAWNNLENDHYLVIEEINRGNCAEIFGDIFQLLDRTNEYKITPSKELKEYLKTKFSENENIDAEKLLLPTNLNILATMNTSDQSLFPMDSAFKRRWDWEYLPICYNAFDDFSKTNASFYFEIDIEDGEKYSWIKFIEKINLNHIKHNQSLGMDKCIGNYFIKPDTGKTISLNPFINKVIFYLWNDVFKDEENKVFEENTTYEDFFPMNTNGKTKIKELFDRIELKPIQNLEITEDDAQLRQVAEDNEGLDS